MQIKYLEVRNKFLRKYVSFYYLLSTIGDQYSTTYLAFPSGRTPLGFFKNASAVKLADKVNVRFTAAETINASIVGNFLKPLEITFEPNVVEFAVIFNPFGVNFFAASNLGRELSKDVSATHLFDDLLPIAEKFIDDLEAVEELENALLARFAANKQLELLEAIIAKLQDTENPLTEQQIAAEANISTKQLFRSFKKHLGVNPTQYRQLLRFRNALDLSVEKASPRSLTSIGLSAGYYDQPHFIKEFKKITNLTPRDFLSKISLEADDKVVWQFLSETSDSYN